MKFAVAVTVLATICASQASAADRISMVPASRFSDIEREDARYSNDGITATLEMPLLASDQNKDFDGYSVLMATCRDDKTPTLDFAISGRRQEGPHGGLALATVGVNDPSKFVMPAVVGGMPDKTLVVLNPERDAMRDILINMYDESRIEFDIIQEDGNKLTL
jgi:hypothetical protein